jgi:uncharacterized protein (TIGR03067 family)
MDMKPLTAELESAIAQAMRALQGEWRQVECEADGVANPAESYGVDPAVTILGNTFEVRHSDGTVVIQGAFTIDPSRDPKEIDWTDTFGADAGKTFPGIYRLAGDTFIFCAADAGQPRPNAFRTQTGQVLRVHQRVAGS